MWKQMKSTAFYLCIASSLLQACHGQCIDDIADVVTAEKAVNDTSVKRVYTLCEKTIYEIGNLDVNFEVTGVRVQPPFPLRPNMEIRCGDTGSRDNLCWIINGDVQVDATKILGIKDDSVENVLIEGFVFISTRKYSVWATKPGSITFKDCEWRDHVNAIAPVNLDFFDGTDAELSVTFEDCLFHNNTFFGLGSNTALVYANSGQNRLSFSGTVFEYNDMSHNNTLAATNSFLIETLGPLTVANSCFENNIVGVSDIAVFGNTLSSNSVYVNNSTGPLCGYASVFETLQQFDSFTPLCIEALATYCKASETGAPTTEPSESPTKAPTQTPSVSPTGLPTTSPTLPPPTISPAPVAAVVEPPTPAPVAPTGAPVGSPTPAPDSGFVFPTLSPNSVNGAAGTGTSGGYDRRSSLVVALAMLGGFMSMWF